ncbi:phosphotransferase [Corynebacterium hindlerae]|uniref:Phosphotransferase n=1 Tax=Corynebacterium hindlerae TaxID=699041 RepID=A0A7G5FFL6_9CORY|nr:phosphotransferase [Corynebacterium hindlerae]QMV85407.1 phosphotransferase [Corynebacterium hindlerae]
MPTDSDIVGLAAELLSKRLGGTQTLSDPEPLSGNGSARVLRARLSPSPFLDERSVVIKYVPPSEDAIDDAALIREIVAYQFTNSLGEDVRPGPVLLGYDVEHRILVITDAGDSETYEQLLAHPDLEVRKQHLRNLGRALGKLHVATATHEQDFDVLLARMLKAHPDTGHLQNLRDLSLLASIDNGLDLIEQSGVAAPEEVRRVAREAKRRLTSGNHRAFTPFDLSPDNILSANRTYFLDYEWAGFRDVTFDVACVVAGFPQFVSARIITDEEVDAFVESWAREVRELWPNADDVNRRGGRIVTALIGWALASVAYLYHGSMNQAVSLVGSVDEWDGEVDPELEALIAADLDAEFNLFTADFLSEGTPEGRLARKDLYETFEALARFAARWDDGRFAPIQVFAETMVDRLSLSDG